MANEENTITKKDILFLLASFLTSVASLLVFYFFEYKKNKEKSKKEDESQNKKLESQSKELGELKEKLFKEEKRKIEEKLELSRMFCSIEKENVKRYYEWFQEEKNENDKLRETLKKEQEERFRERQKSNEEKLNLRKQLVKNRVPWEEHDISDKEQQQEAISEIEARWRVNQNKNGKINEKTITQVLGESWENDTNNKEREEIIKWKDRLIGLIYEEIKLAKQ